MTAPNVSRASALRKIQACLRLAASDNPTEAATALRQARALMEQHGLSEEDAAAADVRSSEAPTGYRGGEIPQSLVALADLVASGYRCSLVIQRRRCLGVRSGSVTVTGKTVVEFYGTGSDPEVAGYAFTVLRRQLQRSRAAHTRRIRKQANRDRRGEEFARGFVAALRRLFSQEEMTQERRSAIEAAIALRHGQLGTTSGKEISKGRASDNDHWAGFKAGKQAQLNQGVGMGTRQLEVIP
ncbi:TPA: DUF2786 domain-containing protein [Stenotrophomonas maltophilia]|nr:DUF2786 domain-containing protein [Stenotrophomonas maltophilia]